MCGRRHGPWPRALPQSANPACDPRRSEIGGVGYRPVGLGDAEAGFLPIVVDDDRPAFGEHESERAVGAVGDALADRLSRDRADAAGDAQFEQARHEQVHQGHLDLQRLRRCRRNAVEQDLRIAGVHRQAADPRKQLAVVGSKQGLLHPRIGADVADRGDDQRMALIVERAQGDLDDHLGAVLAPGDEIGLLAHRPRPRFAREAPAVFGMA